MVKKGKVMEKEKSQLPEKLKQFIGKTLKVIIDMEVDKDNIKLALKSMTGDSYEDINWAKLLLFSDNTALVFVSHDCDGYRDGSWNLIKLSECLDKGATTGIKGINSKVTNIEEKKVNDKHFILITTEEYIILMGRDSSDSYYPRNFFDIEECKRYALGKLAEVLY